MQVAFQSHRDKHVHGAEIVKGYLCGLGQYFITTEWLTLNGGTEASVRIHGCICKVFIFPEGTKQLSWSDPWES